MRKLLMQQMILQRPGGESVWYVHFDPDKSIMTTRWTTPTGAFSERAIPSTKADYQKSIRALSAKGYRMAGQIEVGTESDAEKGYSQTEQGNTGYASVVLYL